MHIVKQLMTISGVIAPGEYAGGGDRCSYRRPLTDAFAPRRRPFLVSRLQIMWRIPAGSAP